MLPEAYNTITNHHKIIKHIRDMKLWLSKNQKEIEDQAKITKSWLLMNEERYNEIPQICRESWWKNMPYLDLNSKDLTEKMENISIYESRKRGLTDKVFENGFRHMIDGLVERQVITEPLESIIHLVTCKYRPMIDELVSEELTDKNEKSIKDLSSRFGFGNSTKFRNKTFIRLINAGILLGHYDGTQYGTRIGPIGFSFMTEIANPVIYDFQNHINSKSH